MGGYGLGWMHGGYGPGFGMGVWGGGMFPFLGIFGLLVFVLVIVGVVWLARAVLHPQNHEFIDKRASAGLDVLNQRYARGEISREEYLQKRSDMWG